MNSLLIATTNPGKLNELRLFLSDLPLTLMSLKDAGITVTAEETGKTFSENAILKARFYAEKSGFPTLADDGGFEIDALHGEPGVKSHRWVYGDRENTDEELIAYTITRLIQVPEGKRGAQLRLVLALATPDGKVYTAEEKVRGIIPLTPTNKVTPGFPYRSLLYLPEISKYYNHDELTPEETDRYNHRKKALDKLRPILSALLT